MITNKSAEHTAGDWLKMRKKLIFEINLLKQPSRETVSTFLTQPIMSLSLPQNLYRSILQIFHLKSGFNFNLVFIDSVLCDSYQKCLSFLIKI